MLRKILLVSGIISSLLYLGIDSLAAMRYESYHSYFSQAISELGAVGAPTERLVHPLFIAYDLLIIAFGVGVWQERRRHRALRLIGPLLIGIGIVGLVTPPMSLRGTGTPSGDLPHIIFTGVIVLFILTAIALGASLVSGGWRRYSCATLAAIVVTGAWTGVEGARLAAGGPTPWLGVAERINIGAYLLWVLLLAAMLLRTASAVEYGGKSGPLPSRA